jgi:hypothetical protein
MNIYGLIKAYPDRMHQTPKLLLVAALAPKRKRVIWVMERIGECPNDGQN